MSHFNRVYTGRGLITSTASVPLEQHHCLAQASFPVSQKIASFLRQTGSEVAVDCGDKIYSSQLSAQRRGTRSPPATGGWSLSSATYPLVAAGFPTLPAKQIKVLQFP